MPYEYITPGTYNAMPMKWAVGKLGQNNLPAVSIEFRLTTDGDEPMGDDGPVIENDFYLQGKDGNLLAFNLDALREAFGWPGNLDWFATVDDLPEVQLVIADDEWKGNVRSKVAFLNKLGATGHRTVGASDPAAVQSIDAQIGARIRAHFGGVSAPAVKPAKPAPPVVAPAAPPKPSAPPTAPVATATQDEAWAEFSRKAIEVHHTEEEMNQLWFDTIALYASDPEHVTGAQWAKVAAHELTPF